MATEEIPFGQQLAEIYDLIYQGRGKDYAVEAENLVALIRARTPDAAALLDVGCGTGEHLRTWRAAFDRVAGLELSADMRAVASRKLPDVTIHAGDMADFALGVTFDVVTCMFSTVGYLPSVTALDSAVACMARHLRTGGTLVVEPWWFPEDFLDGHVAGNVLHGADGRTVARVSRGTREGRRTTVEVHYLVGDVDGVRHFTDRHVNTLFSRDEYLTAFKRAGCSVEFLPDGPSGRGLFVGVREAHG